MAGRRLDPEERALWRKVTASVRPLGEWAQPANIDETLAQTLARPTPIPAARAPIARAPRKAAAIDTLDGGWDRRLRRGVVEPERTIDLHGHTLATAHAALAVALDRAIMDGVRVLLLVTGRPPRDRDMAPRRGVIRASIGDWLGGSRHAARIAAVRDAHPRHGGAGALYVILRRPEKTTATTIL